MSDSPPSCDFFISYTSADQQWAEWIAWTLEEAGYSTRIQAWDFTPGSSFPAEMRKAAAESKKTLAVLSSDYLDSDFAMSEWDAAFAADPSGVGRKLIPVRVRPTELGPLEGIRVYVDLVGLGEAAARERLLAGVAEGRRKPVTKPHFPGAAKPGFPGAQPPEIDLEVARKVAEEIPVETLPEPGPLPPGSRMPLRRNPHFVGREEELRELAEKLRVGGAAAVGAAEAIAAATGLGGLGKTQLAVEFVHRYGQFFPGGVFWLSFADAAAVATEVADCGNSLELSPGYEDLKLERQVRLVREAWSSPLPRLLVFDNCEDPELVRAWRPSAGGSRVLITSRRSRWSRGLGIEEIRLETLPPERGVELLLRFRPDLEEDREPLAEIAEELGHLPLALHLAGSFLERYAYDPPGRPAKYLEALRRRGPLEHRSLAGFDADSNPTRHDLHVGSSFALSYEALDVSEPVDVLSQKLLARAACLALGEPIPRWLLIATLELSGDDDEEESLEVSDAIGRAVELGLLDPEQEGAVRMHRLVGHFVRGLGDQAEPRSVVERVILQEAERFNNAGYPAALRAWQVHLRAVTDAALGREDEVGAQLGSELAFHLETIGNPEAWEYCRNSLAIRKKVLGEEHPDTAESLNNLGFLLATQGDYEAAEEYYLSSLAIREKVLGEEHPDTAESLNNLGALFVRRGDFNEARQYHERALAIWKKVRGEEHLDTARSLNNLGHLLQSQGEYERAREHYERALAIWEKVRGEEHPDTATSLNNLGNLLRKKGELGAARECHERALSIRKKVLGEEHPDTATSLNNLGALLVSQKENDKAREHYERALSIREKVLGEEHPDTAGSLNNLGYLLAGQGEYTVAREYYERALAIRKKILGEDHPTTAISLNNLGGLLNDRGEHAAAREHYERALEILEARVGLEHPLTTRVRDNLEALLEELDEKK